MSIAVTGSSTGTAKADSNGYWNKTELPACHDRIRWSAGEVWPPRYRAGHSIETRTIRQLARWSGNSLDDRACYRLRFTGAVEHANGDPFRGVEVEIKEVRLGGGEWIAESALPMRLPSSLALP